MQAWQAALVPTVGAAAVVWGVRLCAIYCGSFCGAWLGGTPPDLRRMVWQGMVTQASYLPVTMFGLSVLLKT